MNENIDLTKILKDCPIGWEFYSSIYGYVTFYRIEKSSEYPVKFFYINKNNSKKYGSVTKQGLHVSYFNGECTLFPSKDQKDWSKFTAPWYKKERDTIAWLEESGKKEYRLKSFKDEDVRKFIQYIEKQAKAYEFNLPNRSYDIYAFAKDLLVWLEKQGKQEELQVYETEDGKIITYSETDGYKFVEPNFYENERVWLHLVSDVLTWKDGIGQYLDDPRVQELAKRLCSEYAQKLYNPSVLSNTSNTGKNEQKSADKIEQKFKVGDWIISSVLGTAHIIGTNDSNEFQLEYIDGKQKFSSINYVNYAYDKWTIEDAKDGDVLAAHECYVVFKEIDGLNIKCYCTYHYLGLNPSFYRDTLQNKDAFLPATKEQRDSFMKAMNDAGYEWDIKKKELNKKKKFDPNTLKPFDRVLTRDYDVCKWNANFYSHKEVNSGFPYICTNNTLYKYCIPYNDDTKHLVGITDEAPEYYRYWED